jgi:hypothetical protein
LNFERIIKGIKNIIDSNIAAAQTVMGSNKHERKGIIYPMNPNNAIKKNRIG